MSKLLSLICAAWLLLGLSACAAQTPVLEEDIGAGGITPQAAIEKFVEDFNAALADPALLSVEARRTWVARLASHFAPSERIDQREAMSTMLVRFATGLERLNEGERIVVEISYLDLVVYDASGDRAMVALNDGQVTLRWLNAAGEVIRERTRPLMDLLGDPGGGLPLIRVNGRWFLTEG